MNNPHFFPKIEILNELSYEKFEELGGGKIIDISGIETHCFTVSSEGEVFVYGQKVEKLLFLRNHSQQIW